MAKNLSKKHARLIALVLTLIMTLPAVGMIIDGFRFDRVWVAIFGLGLYSIMFCFYIVTGYLVFSNYE